MSLKLDFNYDDKLGCEVAMVGETYRVLAKYDQDAMNPFEDTDGHWPMLVWSSHNRAPDPYAGGDDLHDPITGMSDELLVHDQRAIAKLFGYASMPAAFEDVCGAVQAAWPNRCTDATELRDLFDHCINEADNGFHSSDWRDLIAELWTLAGAVALNTTVTGHSQGDWANLLIVARPADQTLLRGKGPHDRDAILADVQGQADLYQSWAFGDCFGFVVEREVPDPNPEVNEYREREWEEIEHGSCWGFYGRDHEESGLAGAALECLPQEAYNEAIERISK